MWKGSAFGGARGRTDVPKIVDWYMDGKINIDDLITHTMPIEKINDAFDLMHAGQINSFCCYLLTNKWKINVSLKRISQE